MDILGHIRDNSILGHIRYNRHINGDIDHIRTYSDIVEIVGILRIIAY